MVGGGVGQRTPRNRATAAEMSACREVPQAVVSGSWCPSGGSGVKHFGAIAAAELEHRTAPDSWAMDGFTNAAAVAGRSAHSPPSCVQG